MELHEEAKQEDAREFDDCAPGHPVVERIKKIDSVTADGEDDKGVQLPEFVPWGTGRSGYRMVFHLV
jgi:hypothetical protein